MKKPPIIRGFFAFPVDAVRCLIRPDAHHTGMPTERDIGSTNSPNGCGQPDYQVP